MALSAESTATDGLLTFKLDNKAPVALEDLTESLHALADAYRDYMENAGHALPGEGVRLYVHDLRTGSIIAVLQAVADQARFLFGDHGVVPTVQSAFDHPDTLAGFLGSVNDVVQFFLGNTEGKREPTKREAEQIIKIMEPVATDNASQLNMSVGSVSIGELHFHYNAMQANAVQNAAHRYLGPSLPSAKILQDELLVLAQIRGAPTAKTGDRGIIESISKAEVKLLFVSEEVKRAILEAPYPFQKVFVVDVEVKTVDDKVAGYKILAVKDSFDRP